MRAMAMLEDDFATIGYLINRWAEDTPDAPALSDDERTITWREFDHAIDRIGFGLQREGVSKGDAVAIAGVNSIGYALVMFGILRIGGVVALLTTSAQPAAILEMLIDSGARHLFVDGAIAPGLATVGLPHTVKVISHDDSAPHEPLSAWMPPAGVAPAPVKLEPSDPFNIIYSSGTTGSPKGIVQSHSMRLGQMKRAPFAGLGPGAAALYATPLYSNTTLVSLLGAVAAGSRVILMSRFDARRYCEIAQAERVTHTMLVPVQLQRLMDLPEFDSYDLSAFRYKSCTSAPFAAELKAQVIRRWPGKLVEFYGMTEGGGSCMLQADEFPEKLHTVGRPMAEHDIRLVGEDGKEVAPGEIGEVVGRSALMMSGYHRQPEKTAEAEWRDPEGRRFIRHGDLGRFDEDGFLVLVGRAKDMIISGGFNIYPADLEAALMRHPAVADAVVVGAPSKKWGETPAAFVVPVDADADVAAIVAEVNAGLGKTQRISASFALAELPRNAIGKVLKRELRDRLGDGFY